MTDIDGKEPFDQNNVIGIKLDKLVPWHGATNPTAPTNKIPGSGLFLNTTDGVIYQNNGTLAAPSWTVLGGPETFDASVIVSGKFDIARIPNMDAGKIIAGQFPNARIANLPSLGTLPSPSRQTAIVNSEISTVAASKMTTGVLADARIPSLNASKTNAGVFADARIPSLNASKINAGILPVTRGGIGIASPTSGKILVGAGSSAMTLANAPSMAAGTEYAADQGTKSTSTATIYTADVNEVWGNFYTFPTTANFFKWTKLRIHGASTGTWRFRPVVVFAENGSQYASKAWIGSTTSVSTDQEYTEICNCPFFFPGGTKAFLGFCIESVPSGTSRCRLKTSGSHYYYSSWTSLSDGSLSPGSIESASHRTVWMSYSFVPYGEF